MGDVHVGTIEPPLRRVPGGISMGLGQNTMGHHCVVMDFSRIYREESFFQYRSLRWIDCTRLRGTERYCDSEGCRSIRQLIADLPPCGIHFIDNGNYHYVSLFWLEKIRRPFSLVVIDHHTDMQMPLFGDVLSCGGWVRKAMDENPFLRNIVILGAAEELVRDVPQPYRQRVRFYGEEALRSGDGWNAFAGEVLEGPLYISIDKDALDRSIVPTNWDQGTMTREELKKVLDILLLRHTVIGMDVCGESPMNLNVWDAASDLDAAGLNSQVNQEILAIFDGADAQGIVVDG